MGRTRVVQRTLAWVLGLGIAVMGCGESGDEVGTNRARPDPQGGRGGSVGDLPSAGAQGGASGGTGATAGFGGNTPGSGGTSPFGLRAAALGRREAAAEGGMKIRFGGLSALGRVCNDAFCVTGDLR